MLTVRNTLPGTGPCAYMGLHKATRLQKAGVLTISACGQYVDFKESTSQREQKLERTLSQMAYDRASSGGIIPQKYMLHTPFLGGRGGYLRLMTLQTRFSIPDPRHEQTFGSPKV